MFEGCVYRSMAGCLPSVCKALGHPQDDTPTVLWPCSLRTTNIESVFDFTGVLS